MTGFFLFFQKIPECIEFPCPEQPELVHPVGNLREVFQVGDAKAFTSFLPDNYKPAFP
jgi:hypothetical protein